MIEFQDAAPISAAGQNVKSTNAAENGMKPKETEEERVQRLYKSEGGPLIGWLFDEAKSRRQNYREMSAELGVTYGYIAQLRNGIRHSEHISQGVADACARYLGVPAVVVKLIAGSIRMSDFMCSRESEEQVLDRAIRQVQGDPQIRHSLPHDLLQLPLAAKRAVVLMYAESTGHDLFGYRELPAIVKFLQRAVMFHDENEGAALEPCLAIPSSAIPN